MFIRIALLVAMCSLLSACVGNGYQEFYQPAPYAPNAIATPTPFTGAPQVMASSGNLDDDEAHMYEKGLGLVGAASFTGPAEPEANAITQAQTVHASVVLISSHYQSTATGATPITTPTTTTAYSNGTVGGYGYSGTTTVYGTQTTYIPYSIDRYEQMAAFFAPLTRAGLGVYLMQVPTDVRQRIGKNGGVMVRTVRHESPAYVANIVPGDVILSVDGKTLEQENYGTIIVSTIGRSVKYEIWRSGEMQEKDILVPTSW
ncbi:MAG TPA: PDZ domain-containing protein [Dongiaceae bacterium]|nr:PDZ domain-containing protein [Dongiaceae bacterium]